MKIFQVIPVLWMVSALAAFAGEPAAALPAWTVMQQAVLRDQDIAKVESLLKAGFPPAHPIGCGTYDALDGAVYTQNSAMVRLLLKYGARPKPVTVVAAAFLNSEDVSLDILKQFMAVGADVNSLEIYGGNSRMTWTPLDQAVWREHAEVVKWLLAQKGIRVNVVNGDGQTPLMIAVEKGNRKIVKVLLDAGADPRLPTPRHETALTISNEQIDNQRSIQGLLGRNP